MKNLIVNGCSYTDDRFTPTWATMLAKKYPQWNYKNLASGAAGNDYICQSTMSWLESHRPDPAQTLVLIMWSGTGRKDLSIPGDWWYHIKENYRSGRNFDDQEYYIFSGGLTNSWTTTAITKKIFEWPYKLSDPTTLCKDSLCNFINLENYLKVHGYPYLFTSYVNYWHTDQQSNFNAGDYCLGYFLRDNAMYQHYDFGRWFFVNEQRDCLAEFADKNNQYDGTGHPTVQGHQLFCDQIVAPTVQKLLV